MAEITFEGTTKWTKVYPKQLNKFDKWTLQFYPKDKAERDKVKALGFRNQLHEDEDGFYYVFNKKKDDPHSPGPVIVLAPDGTVTNATIWNGSEIEVTLDQYYWDNEFGKGTGGRLVKVQVLRFAEKPSDLPDRVSEASGVLGLPV